MAFELRGIDLTFPAQEDLTSDQYRIVILTSTGVRRPDAATDKPLGVLQNAPAINEAAVVRLLGCGGVSKVRCGAGAQAIGVIVGCEYVGAADAGKAIAAVATMYPVGIVIEASAGEDELATVLLAPLTVKA